MGSGDSGMCAVLAVCGRGYGVLWIDVPDQTNSSSMSDAIDLVENRIKFPEDHKEPEILAKQTIMEYHSRTNRSTGTLKKEVSIHHL